MGVQLLADQFSGYLLPAHEIHQIITADRDHLGRAGQPCSCHPVGTSRDAGSHEVVADLLRGEIQNGGKAPFCCKAFKRTAAHASGMENRHLEPAFFQFRLESHHVTKDRLAE